MYITEVFELKKENNEQNSPLKLLTQENFLK